jgi:hypothetical protein
LTSSGSSTIHIYTNSTLNNTFDTNNTQNNTIHYLERVRTVPRLCQLYPGICLTTEEKARKNLSQGSRRMPVGTLKTEYTEQSMQTIRKLTELNKNILNIQPYKTYNHIHNDKKNPKRTSLHCNTSLHFTTLIDTSLPLIYTLLPSHLA